MSGPGSWSDPIFSEGFYLDGRMYMGGGKMPPLSFGFAPGPTIIPMLGQTDVAQSFWAGGDQPVNTRPINMPIQIQLHDEADYNAIEAATQVGRPVDLWFDAIWTDWWYIPGQATLQTDWKFSRKLPYNLVPSISQTERPPKAWLVEPDGTETVQTIVTSGPPTTNQVEIPDAGGYQFAVTPALDPLTYDHLKIQYHPMFLVKLGGIEFQYQQNNNLIFSLNIQEHRGGLYTPGAGS